MLGADAGSWKVSPSATTVLPSTSPEPVNTSQSPDTILARAASIASCVPSAMNTPRSEGKYRRRRQPDPYSSQHRSLRRSSHTQRRRSVLRPIPYCGSQRSVRSSISHIGVVTNMEYAGLLSSGSRSRGIAVLADNIATLSNQSLSRLLFLTGSFQEPVLQPFLHPG